MTKVDVTQQPIKRALLSVSNKVGLVEFATFLGKHKIEILATGGTAQLLKQYQIPVIDVADYTGFPEILEGRVKTLHPKIHGGLLARPVNDDAVLKKHGISRIDLLIVNLYPFTQTIADPHCTFENAIEKIDVGGPSLLRGAAKNFAAVTVAIDPADYMMIMQEMETNHGTTTLKTRHYLAQKVFSTLASYDAAIANYLNTEKSTSSFPSQLCLNYQKKMDLRYGENPHQAAAVYTHVPPIKNSLANVEPLQGKPLSFNNLLDSDCAFCCVHELPSPACVIVKHATPCGAATASSQLAAYENAYATDPTSAFGGIIAFNTPLEIATAKKILQQFVEVIIAPSFSPEIQQLFLAKPDIRLLACEPSAHDPISLRTIAGGLLAQQIDQLTLSSKNLNVVTQRQPTSSEIQDLLLAWPIVKYVKSNAIVYAKNGTTIGIGGGQTSRVFSTKIAAMKATEAKLSLSGTVMASDAFFPFADSIEMAAEAGITAIIQPGGSKRDAEVIAAADKANIAMLFTGQRHFRH